MAGVILAVRCGEQYMFRAAALSIVLALVVGQGPATLLCTVWCDSQAPATTGCHHEERTGSTSVTGDEDCSHLAAGVVATLRENLRIRESGPGTDLAVTVPPFAVARPTVDRRPGREPRQECTLDAGPRSAVLRI